MKKIVLTSLTAVAVTISSLSGPFFPYQHIVHAATTVEKAPVYKSRSEIPEQYRWKLEHIYPTQEAWLKDVKKVESQAGSFATFQGKLGASEKNLVKALQLYSDLMRNHDKAYIYAKLAMDVNTANPDLQAQADRAEKMSTYVKEKTAWFTPELIDIPEQTWNKYLKLPELAPYKAFIQDQLRTKKHTLSKDMEEMLAQSSPLASTPEDIYRMISKDVKFPSYKNEKGEEIQLTRSNFVALMDNKNQDVRRSTFKTYYSTLQNYQDSFAQALSGKVKATNFYAKVRKYPSALEASLTANNVPTKVYDELIQTVNANLPLLHRYLEVKKKMLGLKEMHMYDLYMSPAQPAENRYIPFEEAKGIVLDGLKPLGDDYTNVLKDAFDKGWVDVYSTDDKRTGAYQWGAYDTHPYLLLNYQGTASDVSTIAHELGHAMQSYYTNQKQTYLNSGYPIFTAEVASTMNETLLFKSLYAKAKTKQEKMFLLNQYLENFRTTLFRQTQFAEFEKVIHEKEQAGESLNAEALKKIYLDINKKYYGKAVVSDEEIAMEWARVPHFYYNFYVYQYATSFAASVALAKQVLDEGKPAVDRIKNNFLAAGNSAPPIEVLKAAGVDMSSSKPIEQAMKVFEENLTELEKLVDEK
ncbi:oligoendopeptidase F [Brevibacillus ginsengisoli]|uniref:oligoendopeptidase F n=1 Tax=Brevibacillus ginsengisoli TaxID=363854 RepID=UPI003CF1478C